ncbi:MAG: histidinol-phosphate aminotransferase family protein [Candidatus Spechtbacteria bacterium]|nr:histidinol-phosphate aminotransferase family protein [Candidatus Spechtbacteria bacterium]
MTFSTEKYSLPQKRYKMPSKREQFIRLDLNESYGLINDDFLAKLKDFSVFTVGCYPEYEELLDLLANYTGVSTKNIFLTGGSDRAIDLLFKLLFREGDKVIMPSPNFAFYNYRAQFSPIQLVEIPYRDNETSFEFPFEETKQALPGAKALLLCNPNNPLGAAMDESQLNELIATCDDQGIPVILDEAYFGFYPHSHVQDILKHKNLIVLRTFSKFFGMAGLRIGYMLADESIVGEIIKLRGPWELSHFSTYAATTALKNLHYFEEQWKKFAERKAAMEKFLRKEGISVYPSKANFFLFKTENSANFLEAMRDHGILINDLSHHPANLPYLANAVRMAVPSEQDMKKVQEAIHQTVLQL